MKMVFERETKNQVLFLAADVTSEIQNVYIRKSWWSVQGRPKVVNVMIEVEKETN